ncbi:MULTISPECIES: magnesium protoporphyrin IX methyltransferase [Prochlorococcus]|uniref:Magnesium protoporphyrin IX methyltransferase n=1 Tax=Prochlorococcus marinus (strain SARG / CCMP1375 / SS120) TaxID=167539 RepID=Q7VE21_PROMA|nr:MULTISPECIES: magnesium protoporphyrin IX methyltransferase [Prochlorococcus]AAP99239.1 Magnesium-protoporphyrin IX methyltransferase [Prochlorococcus marinus subsp. marinus str. CCMP1375]KGG11492.1 Mg-protoporphyrin O-methyltransferase [Prochlorococcus marinus str. LG]KGG18554.1 Mg-protoporphyrin O-methyltransferase [Prochlorococcus marinus str. SS2]KGG22827.1 Mg-protoporphyrin O-methyltransferase [Prochlorococcus marinus str. SS35]KGG32703.1 Mg-protoporphyrin O-methyltransferase [Prochlor
MQVEGLQKLKESEKAEVATYFNGTGFERWNRIYSKSDEVNKVQKNIRIGHQKTVDDVLTWIKEIGEISDMSFCDAGCGVGSLCLPLVALGAGSVSASDISEAMVEETQRRAKIGGLDLNRLNFKISDLESLNGSFDTVICLDVFIHYPQKAAEEMVHHLCGLSKKSLIVSFAPYTPLLALLKTIGQFFPGPSKTTRAYILREKGIINAARACGFEVKRRKLNQAPFYFSQLIEFVKK